MNMIRTYNESIILSRLGFGLFGLLKEDLPKGYLITYTDIEFLIMLNDCYTILGKRKCMDNVLNKINSLITKMGPKEFFSIYCDPYELFIDAGWIDTKLNILLKK